MATATPLRQAVDKALEAWNASSHTHVPHLSAALMSAGSSLMRLAQTRPIAVVGPEADASAGSVFVVSYVPPFGNERCLMCLLSVLFVFWNRMRPAAWVMFAQGMLCDEHGIECLQRVLQQQVLG